MRRTIALAAAMLMTLAPCFAGKGFAQGVQTGTVRGIVTDPQDGRMRGVAITLSSPALQGRRSTATTGDGSYVFRNLPPGTYEMSFEFPAFAPVERTAAVALGGTLEQNVRLEPGTLTVGIQVVGELPTPIAGPVVGANYTHEEVDALPTSRTLSGIAQLAPGLTSNTPNIGQVTINGSLAFDNIHMVDGVDVNDNLLAQPQNLFIEDAIEETQILTSGITAEYGRFTGGVINAITRNGGDLFSGSFRANFVNPSWTTETPLERCDPAVTVATCRPAPPREDNLQSSLEGTFGGPILRDRVWFFTAFRHLKLDSEGTLPVTNLRNSQTDKNERAEFKLTASASPNHVFTGGYMTNYREQSHRPTFSFTIDRAGVGSRTLPNWYAFATYRGILGNTAFAEVQVSRKEFGFKDAGGSLTDIMNSPMITFSQSLAHFNALYFDASDPEGRNNRQVTGNLTYLSEGGNSGRHELKAGYEWFRSQRTGGNSQSATNYVFIADYAVDASGNPIQDAQGFLQPVFAPGGSELEEWQAVRGAVLNVDNQSVFAQDHWSISPRLSADLGVRFEHIRSRATGGVVGLDTSSVAPRLAAAYDLEGNGGRVVRVTYGHYSGRANEAQIEPNTNVGNPDALYYEYVGPAGQRRDFSPGFDLDNYVLYGGEFPSANVSVTDDLRTPLAKEATLSFGSEFMDGKGFAEASYVHRNYSDLIEDTITVSNGSTTVAGDGTFSNVVWANSDEAFREYRGLLFQARYNVNRRWLVNGHYTLQLRNNGNYEGEAPNQPGIGGLIGDYPEARSAARHWLSGRLDDFQRQHPGGRDAPSVAEGRGL